MKLETNLHKMVIEPLSYVYYTYTFQMEVEKGLLKYYAVQFV